ncbi:MAG TPA: MMPL family transporter, partial [Fibrobacteria bacterium]|nr:MMPL family transporter [Fibrobacteria bacterium]
MLQKILQIHRAVFVVFLLLMVAITVVSGLQVKAKSRMETDLDNYMPQNHPAFIQSDLAEERFHIRDGVLIAIENSKGIYNSHTIAKIRDLSIELEDLEEIESGAVTSLYSADNIVGVEDGLDVKPFYRKIPESAEELELLRKSVRNNTMIHGRLVSTDETVAIIVAEIEDNVFTQEFYQKLIHLAKKHEGEEKIYVAGRPIVEGSMALLAPKDMKKMVPIVVMVIILVLFAFMKSVRGTVVTLA